ncbi:MAG: GtrA family protein [Oscillospiraceae bacterium]|nr:GtrA family protein [Oscillospiraceae bacterium]
MKNTIRVMTNRIKKWLKSREMLLYVIFGTLTTLVSFAAYFLFRWIFAGYDTPISVVFSWICTVTFAFVTNRLFVFNSTTRGAELIKEAVLFYASRLLTLSVDLLMMFLLVDLTGLRGVLYEFAARCFVSVFVLILNYILSKVVIFKK